ncbi:hypothetical protein [uncultured Clostridium sp.]|uniref:hypothetical protein n=1 Tax=uncultured Clostridium sp. TaxID=59620 RepID=UPI0026F3E2FC|nr:hypothetical protein [uncultured Clostridium sp.]
MNKTFNNLIACLCMFVFTGLFIFFLVSAKSFPIELVLIALVIYRVAFGVPYFVYSYYKMKGAYISILGAWCPLYNESTIMNPSIANIYIGLCVCLLCELLGFFVPLNIVQNIMGANADLMDWYVLIIRIFLLTYIAMSIVRGIGYIKIFIDIEETKTTLLNMTAKYGIVFFLSSLIVCIPLVRILALCIQQTFITKVLKSKYLEDIPSNSQYDWDNR